MISGYAPSRRPSAAIPIVSALFVWSRRLVAVFTALAAGMLVLGYLSNGRVIEAEPGPAWYLSIFAGCSLIALLTLGTRRLARHIEREVRLLSSIDFLTGLPNRSVLMESLGRDDIALLYMDLDRFKVINDSLGHDTGDDVLKIVAQRIRRVVRQDDLVVRLGGDEFVVVVEDDNAEKVARACAARIISALHMPLRAERREMFVTASIGIAVKCEGLGEPTALMRAADLALYRAKRQGRDQVVVFNNSMEANVLNQLDLESDLWRAVERGQLEVHFQPEVCMETGRVAGLEALVRWRHPELGLLAPDRFIGLAEENGALRDIGLWVIEYSCRQWRRWQDLYPSNEALVISINMSLRQLEQEDLVERVQDILAATGMTAANLKLEITESVLLSEGSGVVGRLDRLRGMGIRLAIDDFGTGYSSLNYLKKLLVHSVKIDQSFVRNLETDDANLLIIQAIVTLAHDLGLDVTAAGVETKGQLKSLRDLGCDRGQGFYLSEPLPIETLDSMLRAIERRLPTPVPAA